jgi:hypothetical protein
MSENPSGKSHQDSSQSSQDAEPLSNFYTDTYRARIRELREEKRQLIEALQEALLLMEWTDEDINENHRRRKRRKDAIEAIWRRHHGKEHGG